MKKTESITQNFIFRALYRRGRQVSCKTMVVYLGKNRLKTVNRLGLTVSTKLGCAVVRNRVRRRLREAYRLMEDSLDTGFDIVIAARSACEHADFSVIRQDMRDAFVRLGVQK
ncbi:MAG: ribonuclease P protein component [Clostridia bacterium]|nr:ribonuclease P protein component [Clostridia bacterium]